MRKNKLWALLIVMVLSVGLLSGCSQAETGLIDLMGEMNKMKTYESQETVSLRINKLPSDISKSDPAGVAIAQSLLSKYVIKSDVRMDTDQQVFDGTFYLVDSASGAETQILSYVASGGTVYVKVDDLASFARTLGNKQLNQKLSFLGDTQYVSISAKEMASLMNVPGQTTGFDLTDIQKQQALYQKLMNTLTEEAFAGYETGMVQKNGNKYTLKIDKQAVLSSIKPFMVYSINNAEKINSSTAKFLQSLDAEELAMLSLSPQLRTTAINEMAKATNDVVSNRDVYLAEVDTLADAAKQGSDMVGDKTGMTIVVEKLGAENYKQTTDLALQFMDPANPADTMDASLSSTAVVKGIDPFTVTVPDQGIISMTELQKKIPRVLTIYTAKKLYLLNQGLTFSSSPVDVRIVKGRTYLPIRAIGEAMNETVGWNPTIKKAYVVKNGKTINLTGAIFNSRAFIQIRDFEKLGYTVTWDGTTKTATLSQ
jgi:hypothetical protein